MMSRLSHVVPLVLQESHRLMAAAYGRGALVSDGGITLQRDEEKLSLRE